MSAPVGERRCPECGLGLPPDGACPNCLLRLALGELEGAEKEAPFLRRFPGLSSRFFGDYEILEEIARGGMGVVYRARQLSLNRIVALKAIQAGELLSSDARLRFAAEVAAVAQMNHPHVVPLYESGVFQGTHFFTMRLVDGGSLAQQLQAARPGGATAPPCVRPPLTSTRTIVAFVSKTARALHHAHQRGIIHRDIKPSNILVDSQGEPHLVDFGVAKLLGQEAASTYTDTILGSPNYMAPEQAMGRHQQLTTATDVYGLGAVLYEMLTGMPPFLAATPVETLRKVLDEDPIPLRRLKPDLEADLAAICGKCLEKDPAARYGTAEQLGEDLERWLAGMPVGARPIGAAGSIWRWSRRHPALATLFTGLVVGLVLIAIGATLAALRIRRAERQAVAHWRDALLDQARAVSLSGEVGMRTEALRLIQQAATLGDSPDFRRRARDQMLLALALTDMSFVAHEPVASSEMTLRLLDPRVERLASIRSQTNLVLHRISDHKVLMDVPTGGSPVTRVESYSPDGRYLVLRHAQGLSIWDTMEGRRCFATNGPKRLVRFSSQSPLMILEEWDYGISFRELPTFREVRRWSGRPDPPGKTSKGWMELSISPDESLVAGARAHENALELIEVSTGRVRWRATNAAPITAMAWSSSRQQLATASADQTLRLWTTVHGKPSVLWQMVSPVTSLAVDPDGSLLAVASEGGIVQLFDLPSRRRLSYTKSYGYHLTFDPEGRRLGTVRRGQEVGWLDLARSSEFSEVIVAASGADIKACEFSPDDRMIAAGFAGQIELRGVDDGRVRGKLPVDRLPLMAFDPADASIMTSNSKGVRRWSGGAAPTDAPSTSTVVLPGPGWRAMAFSRDGSRFVAANASSNAAYVFDPTRMVRLTTLTPHAGIGAAAVSPDGKVVATFSERTRDVCVWDAVGGARLTTFPASARSQVIFSGDGRWLLTGGESMELRDTQTWAQAPTLPFPSPVLTQGAATFSPDGRVLAVVVDDFEIQLFDLKTWESIGRLRPPRLLHIHALAFSHDGTRLAVGCSRGRLRIWSLDVIRRELAEAGLDWDLPSLPDRPPPPESLKTMEIR